MRTNKYEETDRNALYQALLGLKTCPNCREDLKYYPLAEDVWGCERCKETWFLPVERGSIEE